MQSCPLWTGLMWLKPLGRPRGNIAATGSEGRFIHEQQQVPCRFGRRAPDAQESLAGPTGLAAECQRADPGAVHVGSHVLRVVDPARQGCDVDSGQVF